MAKIGTFGLVILLGYTKGVSQCSAPIQKKIDPYIKTDQTGPNDYLACLSYKKPPYLPLGEDSLANARSQLSFSFSHFSTVGACVQGKCATLPFPITMVTLYSVLSVVIYTMFVLLHSVYKYSIYSVMLYRGILSYIYFSSSFTKLF